MNVECMAAFLYEICQTEQMPDKVQSGEKSLAGFTLRQPAAWNSSRFQIPKETAFELRREKLLSSMAEGQESAVVIHAGAGYGKTTVMAEWAAEHRAQSCWYRLHESDNQFGRFLCGIAAALSGVANTSFLNASLFNANSLGAGIPGENILDESFLNADVLNASRPCSKSFTDSQEAEEKESPARAGEKFLARCLSVLPAEPVFICLDDFHLIHNEVVLYFFLQFMEYGEGKARFFFTSKCGFPDFLAASLMRGTVREVLEDELRFGEGETAHLLKSMSGRELPEHVIKEIYSETHGWPAGVVFAGLDLKKTRRLSAGRALTEMPPAGKLPEGSMSAGARSFDRTHLYQYIFYEIFRKLAYDTQRFLTESSALGMIRPALCDHALGRSDSAGMLRYLVQEHLFLSPVHGEDTAYFYEGVWEGFLRSRLSDSRRVEILLRAAQYHARRSEWEEAVRDAMACGEKGCNIVAAVFEKRAAEVRTAKMQMDKMQTAEMKTPGGQTSMRKWIDHLADFQEKLTDSALYAMYEYLYQDGERERGVEFLRQAAKKASAKLRQDLYERYMHELAAVEDEIKGGTEGDWKPAEDGKPTGDAKFTGNGKSAGSGKSAGNGKQTGDEKPAAPPVGEKFLYVQCMGSLFVRGPAGEVVWRTKKTKELFACLFYEDGRWMARDVLTERLWKDKPADRSSVLFHTTASYLRKALASAGAPECLLVKNQSYALDMALLHSDIGSLRDSYNRMKKGEELSKEHAARLISLYRQDFLSGEDYVWAETYREQVERRYLWMLQTLAGQSAARGHQEEAAVYLKKAVEVDNYALDVMEQIVECLIRCRDIAGAKRVYQKLTEASLEILEEKPERTFEEFVRECGKG